MPTETETLEPVEPNLLPIDRLYNHFPGLDKYPETFLTPYPNSYLNHLFFSNFSKTFFDNYLKVVSAELNNALSIFACSFKEAFSNVSNLEKDFCDQYSGSVIYPISIEEFKEFLNELNDSHMKIFGSKNTFLSLNFLKKQMNWKEYYINSSDTLLRNKLSYEKFMELIVKNFSEVISIVDLAFMDLIFFTKQLIPFFDKDNNIIGFVLHSYRYVSIFKNGYDFDRILLSKDKIKPKPVTQPKHDDSVLLLSNPYYLKHFNSFFNFMSAIDRIEKEVLMTDINFRVNTCRKIIRELQDKIKEIESTQQIKEFINPFNWS